MSYHKLIPNNKFLFILSIVFLLVSFFFKYNFSIIFNLFKNTFNLDFQNKIEHIIFYLPILSIFLIFLSYIKQYNILLRIKLFRIILSWFKHFFQSICKENGYLVIFSIIGIYITVYSLFESKSSRDLSRINNEYSIFISLTSSGNNIALQSAMSIFQNIYNEDILVEPNIINFLSWMEKGNPYKYSLWLWLKDYLSNCTIDKCGKENYRIYLSRINFNNIILSNINFSSSKFEELQLFNSEIIGSNFNNSSLQNIHISNTQISSENGKLSTFLDSDMRGAVINKSNLKGTNFDGANFNRLLDNTSTSQFKSYFITKIENSDLRYCTFDKANLSYAILNGTNIQGVDFSTAIIDNIDLNNAIYDKYTKFPKNFSIDEYKMKKIE